MEYHWVIELSLREWKRQHPGQVNVKRRHCSCENLVAVGGLGTEIINEIVAIAIEACNRKIKITK